MSCEQATFIVAELQATAPGLLALLFIAVGALGWQFYDDVRRDRICGKCSTCRRALAGTPPPPPPSSGVTG